MSNHTHRGWQGGRRSRAHHYRSSRSPTETAPYRPSEDHQRSFTAGRRGGRGRRGGNHGGRGNGHGQDRRRPQLVNRLPNDHPLIREIQELKRVRWNRLQDWIRLAQRLGSDWDHPRCPDYLEFRDEEEIATERLEKLAGAIALAERDFPFDQETERRQSEFSPKQPIQSSRKRKHNAEPQTWTEKNAERKVEAWMKQNNAKTLDDGKPTLPITIGSSDESCEDLFLPDETNRVKPPASDGSDSSQGTNTGTVHGPTGADRIKREQLAVDTFSSTRDRADEFLQELASEPLKKARARLPAPPIVPIADDIEEPGEKIRQDSAGKQAPSLEATDFTVKDGTPSKALTEPTEEIWTLENFLRSLNNGGAEQNASQQATQKPPTAPAMASQKVVDEVAMKKEEGTVMQEQVDLMALVRALNPQDNM